MRAHDAVLHSPRIYELVEDHRPVQYTRRILNCYRIVSFGRFYKLDPQYEITSSASTVLHFTAILRFAVYRNTAAAQYTHDTYVLWQSLVLQKPTMSIPS